MPKNKDLKQAHPPQKTSVKIRVTRSSSQSKKSKHKKKKGSSKNPYASIYSKKRSPQKKRKAYEGLLLKSRSSLQHRSQQEMGGGLEGTAYAEFYPDTLKEDMVSAGPFALLANSVHQNIYYPDAYPKTFLIGLAEVILKKDKQGWYVHRWSGDGLAKTVLYEAIKVSFSDSHIKSIAKRIQHKKIHFKFEMQTSKELNNYEDVSKVKYNAGKVEVSNFHRFEDESVDDVMLASQLAASVATGGLHIDLVGTYHWINDKINKMKRKNRVPLWLKKMKSSKAYQYTLNRDSRLRM